MTTATIPMSDHGDRPWSLEWFFDISPFYRDKFRDETRFATAPFNPARFPIREDLILKAEAERLGWTVTFRNDHWHNGASFQRGDRHIWWASGTWRAKDVINGFFEDEARIYGDGYDALLTALRAEAGEIPPAHVRDESTRPGRAIFSEKNS